jgi:asparagine synthase (glutamine-hydrolysing)
MTAGDEELRGADPDLVREALDSRDPLPGAGGFAGVLDGRVVGDVLGREPLFLSEETGGWTPTLSPDPDRRSVRFPAGSVLDRSRLSDPDLDPRAAAERVLRLPDPPTFEDRKRAVSAVRSALDGTTVPPACPVAFSGGVDSAIVAAATEGPLYVAGFPDSEDVTAARTAARAMDREDDLTVLEVEPTDLERVVPAIARATGRTNAMDVAILAPLWIVAERASADGHDRLAVGQGADELFGGYDKVAKAPTDPRLEADTVRGAAREMVRTLPEQLARDVPGLRAAGVDPVAPMLSDAVVEAALRLPGGLLVSDRGERKYALRLAAREFVPDTVAFREKKAVQYGSLVARELDRLAREAGFKKRRDDHVGAYVRSLLE